MSSRRPQAGNLPDVFALLAATVLSAAPVVVVPFDVLSPDPRKQAAFPRALQSLVEADLRGCGVEVRTEDDLDSKNWGKIKGASLIIVGTHLTAGNNLAFTVRAVGVDQVMAGITRLRAWDDRQAVCKMVLRALGLPMPQAFDQLEVTEALLVAWGEALNALHDGAPAVAREKIAAVAKQWPAFKPATERLAQLGK